MDKYVVLYIFTTYLQYNLYLYYPYGPLASGESMESGLAIQIGSLPNNKYLVATGYWGGGIILTGSLEVGESTDDVIAI